MNAETVHAYAGSRYPERPRSFEWEGQRRRVERVLAEWRTPEAHCFRVRCVDGALFEMCYRPKDEAWDLRETSRIQA